MVGALNRDRRDAWLVLWSGPAAWFLQQLTLFQLTLPTCHDKPWLAPVVGAAFLLIPCISIAYSARAVLGSLADATATPIKRFVLTVGGVAAVVFLIAMLWQEIATLTFTGCER
jgi:hypothetical protein